MVLVQIENSDDGDATDDITLSGDFGKVIIAVKTLLPIK